MGKGISAVQDAILFCVMVSIASAIMLPSFISVESYMEKEKEEMVEEILHSFLVCRVDEFEYHFGGSEDGIIGMLMKNLFGREQKHLTYEDICSACLASQFKYGGVQMNLLTKNFSKNVKASIKKFFDEVLEEDYNLTLIWKPFENIDFGGSIMIGKKPTGNVYTARATILLPSIPLWNFLFDASFHIFNTSFHLFDASFHMLSKAFYMAKGIALDTYLYGLMGGEEFEEIVGEMEGNFYRAEVKLSIWDG